MPLTGHTPTCLPSLDGGYPALSAITIGASATWRDIPHRPDWLEKHGFSCAYAPDPDRLNRSLRELVPYIQRGMRVRHHGYFPGREIGHRDPKRAEEAVQFHLRAMAAIRGIGEPVMTVHVGLDPFAPLDHCRVVENLSRLCLFGKRMGIRISLENLRRGPTSNPEILLQWAGLAGASVTLDVGHAVSSQCVRRGEISVVRIIEMVEHRLMEVHMYESETDRHWPPRNMAVLGPIVDRLADTGCRWWTIELDSPHDLLHTRKLLDDHLRRDRQNEIEALFGMIAQ